MTHSGILGAFQAFNRLAVPRITPALCALQRTGSGRYCAASFRSKASCEQARLTVAQTGDIKNEMIEFRRAKILDTASQLFFDNGYNGTTIDDIAARLGVTKRFIYHCFDSKAELLTEVCNRTTAFAAAIADEARGGSGPPKERLRRFARDLTLRIVEGRVYLAVLFREEKHLPTAALAALKRDRRRFNSSLSALLEEGHRAGEFKFGNVDIALQAITGMTTWIFSWYQPTSSISAEQLADEMETLVLQSVGARKQV